MPKSFYITTPIYYVNDRPHIGHASTTVWADVQARYRRMLGAKTLFLTGLDEHGMKVQQAAEKRGVSPQQHCDEMAPHFQSLWKTLNISNNAFIRTTDSHHKKVVQDFLSKLHAAGQIYKKKYHGWYSRAAEQFVTEKEMVDGKFPAHLGEVIELEEENYFFKMSAHQEWLIDYIKKNPEWIRPENRRNEVLGTLQRPLEDLCISRPKARLAWGIPIPFDPEYVTYVWVDALVNYISAIGYGEDRFNECWPADYHLIAKDILTTHCVYWPTMLHAVGLEMPRCILAHGWWLFRDEKMSKTLGNIVNPLNLIGRFGADAVRYFICRELQLGTDTDFSEERFLQRFNADLANDLGNLVNRSLSMLQRYRDGVVPEAGGEEKFDEELKQSINETYGAYRSAMDQVKYGLALESVWKLVTRGNRYVDENAPWKLAKEATASKRLDTVLNHLVNTVAHLARFIAPFMPSIASKIESQLLTPGLLDKRNERLEVFYVGALTAEFFQVIPTGHKIGKPEPLFPRQAKE